MKKIFLTVIAVILAVMTCSLVIICGCGKEDEFPTWDISNGSKITASFSDNGKYGFILTVEGSGKMKDYSSAKDAPWYSKSGRVTDIVVSDGITYIGNNSFTNCAAKTVVLPRSVTGAGENAFSANARVYAYSKITAAAYVYSETEPTSAGNYWHYVDGAIAIWPNLSGARKILFIGNSYTYYNALPVLFKKVANGAGVEVEVNSVTVGSRRFSEWGNPANDYGKLVEAELTKTNDYDIIVLQDRSVSPLSEYNASLTGLKALANRIAETQVNCSVYLYQTWGNPSSQGNYGGSIPAMEARLRTAYENMATEIGASVSYVGKAFTYVYETYDLATQGKNSDKWLYQSDNSHPTFMGSYLAACVHAATMLGIDPRTSTYNGEVDAELTAGFRAIWEGYNTSYSVGIDEATATLMKEIAYSIVNSN